MKIVCICDAGAPEMLMQMMKKLPGCEIKLHVVPEMMDIRHLTAVERASEKGGAEVYEASDELINALAGADAIVTHCTPVNKAMLDAAPDLKYLGCMRTGIEHLNMDVCNERGITVFNANGRNAVAVADQTVAMMLCEMRNIARGHRNNRCRKDRKTGRSETERFRLQDPWLRSVPAGGGDTCERLR